MTWLTRGACRATKMSKKGRLHTCVRRQNHEARHRSGAGWRWKPEVVRRTRRKAAVA